MYAIIGCGSVGYNVAKRLVAQGRQLLVVDASDERVASLREQEIDARLGDMHELAVHKEDLARARAVLVLSSRLDSVRAALAFFRKELPSIPVICRAADKVARETLRREGAAGVVVVQDALAQTVIGMLEKVERRDLLNKMEQLFRDADSLAVFLQNNPDPDSLSSAMGLKALAEHVNPSIKVTLCGAGDVGRAQNQAMMNLLGIRFLQLADADEAQAVVQRAALTALVDSSIPGRNNPLPADATPHIVIDHHEVDVGEVRAVVRDIRPDLGATATIITTYLQQSDFPPSPELAVALMYGIRSDTLGLTRDASAADLEAVLWLSSFADLDVLRKIESPPMEQELAEALARGILQSKERGSVLVAFVGAVVKRDHLAYVADFLLGVEGVDTVFVYGIVDNDIQISARTKDVRLNVAQKLVEAFGSNRAGGHDRMAGGTVPLEIFGDLHDTDTLYGMVQQAVQRRIFKVLGLSEEEIQHRAPRETREVRE